MERKKKGRKISKKEWEIMIKYLKEIYECKSIKDVMKHL